MHPAARLRCVVALIVALVTSLARAQAPDGESPPVSERPARIDSTNPSCQPAWPAASLKAGATGTTVVRFVVDAKGRITQSEVVRPSGPSLEHRLMDYAFLQALSTCPYSPGVDWKGNVVGGTITASHVWSSPDETASQR